MSLFTSNQNDKFIAADEEEAWKKYHRYDIEVDPDQDDKAKEILLCSNARPHMRAFHCAWWSFFSGTFLWFAIVPLLDTIGDDLGLTKREVWTSSIASVGGNMLVRLMLGPLCDVYGPRTLFSIVLCAASIPTACTGLINGARDLIILRSFIGIAGGTFVMSQYWMSRMFTKEVVGTATALVAGWGNLGAGVTQLVIGSYLYPLFKLVTDDASQMAWRTVCILPAVVAFVTGVVVFIVSDDAPKGNYNELRANNAFTNNVSVSSSVVKASLNPNTWILFLQYACCFGVEMAMNYAAALYFRDEFALGTDTAAAIASIFGWLNLFARGLGGFFSDCCNHRWGMRGRLFAQTICLVAEGALVLVFASTTTLGSSITTLIFFSVFVQATEGTTYAIVSYVDPLNMGSVCGIVGAGGSVGAVAFSIAFRELDYFSAFLIMGLAILASSLLSVIVFIKGYAGLLWGKDERVDKETGQVLTANNDSFGCA